MSEQKKKISIPGFTLVHQNGKLREELVECFSNIMDKGIFIQNQHVKTLEKSISDLCHGNYGIAVASGSDALFLSLVACGVKEGDEVITTPFTFFATAGSISRVGAKPIFVDINSKTFNVDVDLVEKKITSKTKAIIPVHLYGCPADMDVIVQLAKKYDLRVIEDAAQALGAKYNGKPVGTFGDAGCYSFFPTKNLGAFGDGGMVVTNKLHIADRIRLMRVHGAKVKYNHELLGYNSRLDELQAAILNVKIKYMDEWTKRRREIAKLYDSLLKSQIESYELPIKIPYEPSNVFHVYHQYTIQTDKRDQLKDYLYNRGIGSTIYYPIPMHLQRVYSALGYQQNDFPIAETASRKVLSLPMFPELADDEVKKIVEAIIDFFH